MNNKNVIIYSYSIMKSCHQELTLVKMKGFLETDTYLRKINTMTVDLSPPVPTTICIVRRIFS